MPPIVYDTLVKRYDVDCAVVSVYTDYVVTEVKEGVDFNLDNAKVLARLVKRHFNGRPFGYISNRTNSYSNVPIDFSKVKEVFPSLAAFAVVVYNPLQKRMVEIENQFYEGNMETFSSLKNAMNWMRGTVSNYELTETS